jgi:hypothetical protein
VTLASPRLGPAGAALALALAAGCSRPEQVFHVETVRVADTYLATAAEVGIDRAAVEAAARAALAEAGFLLSPGTPSYRARVEIAALGVGPDPGRRGLRVEARVELELVPAEGREPARRELGAAGEPVAAEGPAGATRRALGAAVGEAARALRVGLAAEGKSVEALLADLESSDVRVRDQAVQTLGERRERRAVPGLVKRLTDMDRRVRDRALGALSQIKDPAAVPAIIEISRATDAAVTLRLVPVVGDIGGRDAEGWLLTLEQAHPDPRVQAAAADALKDLRRAAAAGQGSGGQRKD